MSQSFSKVSSWFNIKHLIRALYIFLPLWALFYNTKMNLHVGLFLYSGVYYAIFFAVVLVLVFLTFPVKQGVSTARWYDFLLAALGVYVCYHYAINYEELLISGGAFISPFDVVVGVIGITVILEAVRRTTGWAMVIVCLFFVVHVNFAYHFPSILFGPKVSFDRAIGYLVLSSAGVFGIILGVAATFIIAFTTFGSFLVSLGAGDKFTNLAMSVAGRFRGGSAKVAIIGSSLMGTMTGSPIANVGITGAVSIPLMKKTGFRPEFAAAVETTASVGGVIMPPMMGAIIFLMVELTGFSYLDIIKAAITPAVLYFIALYLQVDIYAKRHKMSGLPASQIPDRGKSFRESRMFLVVLAFLIFLIAVMFLDAVVAVYYSLGLMVVLSFFDKKDRATLSKIVNALEGASKGAVMITPIIAAAGLIFSSVALSGVGVRLARGLLEVSGGSLLVLTLLTALICYVMGLGVSAMLAYILLATLVAPAMVEFGVPVIAAHFFIIYMGLSGFFTPPYGVVAAVASPLAGARFYGTCFQSMKLAIVAYLVPITLVLDPVLVLENVTFFSFVFRLVIVLSAIYIFSTGLQGYFFNRDIAWWERVTWSVGGILLFIPYASFLYIGGVIFLVSLGVFFLNPAAKLAPKKLTG